MEINNINAVLFVTHIINNEVLDRYYELERDVKDIGKLFLLLHREEDENNIPESEFPENITPYIFNIDSLDKLDYEPIEETITPGSNHFATLQFFLDHLDFKYYWVIEYDVIYTGKWTNFFLDFDSIDADFIASHIERFPDNPFWYWWDTLYLNNIVLDKHQLIKSFNPIYRISNGALEFLNNLLKGRDNWGHHEVIIPTALNYFNFKILDFGGNGEFVLPQFEEKFYLKPSQYTKGTMRDSPKFELTESKLANKLYHPIKLNKTNKVLSILVTYNGQEYIKKCIDSLIKSSYKNEILVIDNNSNDLTVEIIKKDYPDIMIVENDQNIGFGQANNIGFRYALDKEYDYILLINQDAIVEQDSIFELIRCHNKHSSYGILSPLHLSGDGKNFDNNFFRYFSSGCMKYIKDSLLSSKCADVYPCSFVNAAIWLLTRDCLMKVGGFNPIFFHNGEDVDYVNRLHYKGLYVGVCPSSKALHARENRIIKNERKDYFRHKYILTILELINPNIDSNLYGIILNYIARAIGSFITFNLDDSHHYIKIAFKLIMQKKQILAAKILNKQKAKKLYLFN